jgi:hypothetical protein
VAKKRLGRRRFGGEEAFRLRAGVTREGRSENALIFSEKRLRSRVLRKRRQRVWRQPRNRRLKESNEKIKVFGWDSTFLDKKSSKKQTAKLILLNVAISYLDSCFPLAVFTILPVLPRFFIVLIGQFKFELTDNNNPKTEYNSRHATDSRKTLFRLQKMQ